MSVNIVKSHGPKVSVVIPIYNVEKYLEQCLRSVLEQTLQDIEVICIDDGSTDGSAQLIDAYAANDSRMRVVHRENGGYGSAVNAGMDMAQGKYIAIVESDDYIKPNMYERLFQLAESKDLDVIKADFYRFVGNDETKAVYSRITGEPLYNCVIENDPAKVLRYAALYTWSGIYRLEYLRENDVRHNETPGASYQDNGFWFLSMAAAKRVYFLDEAFYMLRRDNPNSSIRNKDKVFCICDEYEYIYQRIVKIPELYSRLVGCYWWARIINYRTNYFRVAPEHKEKFAQHFSEVIRLADLHHVIPWELLSKSETRDVRLLISDWKPFHRKNRNKSPRDWTNATVVNQLLWNIEDNGVSEVCKQCIRQFLRKFANRNRL